MRKLSIAIILMNTLLVSFILGCTKTIHSNSVQEGQFYQYYLSADNDICYYLVSQEIVNQSVLDTENLELSLLMNRNYMFWSQTNDPEEIRLNLLENGLAKIIDNHDASDAEKEKQRIAKENHRGLWGGSIHSVWNFLKEYQLVFGLIFPSGIIVIIVKTILRRNKLRRICLVLGGAILAGKTTLSRALRFTEATQNDLLETTQTHFRIQEKFSMNFSEKCVSIILTDQNGMDNANIINILAKSNQKTSRQYVIIILLAPTRFALKPPDEQKFDDDYIAEQLSTIENMWEAVLKSPSSIKPKHVIAFVNKCDLYDYKDKNEILSRFTAHISRLEDCCKEMDVNFKLLVGSAVRRDSLLEIKKLLLD